MRKLHKRAWIGVAGALLVASIVMAKGWKTSSGLRAECEERLAAQLGKSAVSLEEVGAARSRLGREARDPASFVPLQDALRAYWFDLKSLRDQLPASGCGRAYFTRAQSLMDLVADTRQKALDHDPGVDTAPILSQAAWTKSRELAESCCSRVKLLLRAP